MQDCGTWLYDDYENSDPAQVEQFHRELTNGDASEATDGNYPDTATATPALNTSSVASSTTTLVTGSSSSVCLRFFHSKFHETNS